MVIAMNANRPGLQTTLREHRRSGKKRKTRGTPKRNRPQERKRNRAKETKMGDMLTSITGFLAWFKSYKRWSALLLCCAVMLFLPSEWLRRLSLLDFATKYRPWIAVGALGSTAVLVAELLDGARKWIFNRYDRWRSHRVSVDYLRNLTTVEKVALNAYISGDTETRYFPMDDGVSSGLVAKGLIYRSSSVGNLVSGFAHNIQPWVRHYLLKNPSLLEGAGIGRSRSR
jgi:hypothetical protein